MLSKLKIGHNIGIRLREDVLITDHVHSKLSVLFISDTHITRWSRKSIEQLLNHVHSVQPDLILMGGDYIESLAGMKLFEQFIEQLTKLSTVAAIAGNHDYFFGLDRISGMFEQAGAHWIDRTSFSLTIRGQKVVLDGNRILTNNLKQDQPDTLRILISHKPVHPELTKENYDLVFAGHLHGGQIVLKQKNTALYPGKWLFDLNHSKIQMENEQSLYLISLGAGDSVPIRYNCPREILLVQVQPSAATKTKHESGDQSLETDPFIYLHQTA